MCRTNEGPGRIGAHLTVIADAVIAGAEADDLALQQGCDSIRPAARRATRLAGLRLSLVPGELAARGALHEYRNEVADRAVVELVVLSVDCPIDVVRRQFRELLCESRDNLTDCRLLGAGSARVRWLCHGHVPSWSRVRCWDRCQVGRIAL